jgi:hypothetical protein
MSVMLVGRIERERVEDKTEGSGREAVLDENDGQYFM